MNLAYPTITIIMPIRNEERFIGKALQSILAQSYPHQYISVMVVDGMSTDATKATVIDTATTTDMQITLIDNPQQILPAGFNKAFKATDGDIIIIVGGHCELAPNYVSQCVKVLQNTAADCVGGPITTVGTTTLAKVIATAQSSPFGVGGVAFRTQKDRAGLVDTVAFGAYRREVFDRIGLLDEELVRNQDDEFNFRLVQAGGRIWLDPSIQSIYYSRATLSKLWQQYFQYGAYKVRVIQKRGAVPSWRHLVPALFVSSLLGAAMVSLLTGNLLWLAMVLIPYLITMVISSIVTAEKKIFYLLYLPIIFAILHIAYGIGFLWGLWRWRAYGFPKLKLAAHIGD